MIVEELDLRRPAVEKVAAPEIQAAVALVLPAEPAVVRERSSLDGFTSAQLVSTPLFLIKRTE
jgi:hypothetical protein